MAAEPKPEPKARFYLDGQEVFGRLTYEQTMQLPPAFWATWRRIRDRLIREQIEKAGGATRG